jgi:uroporphyrinogen decarboxylase
MIGKSILTAAVVVLVSSSSTASFSPSSSSSLRRLQSHHFSTTTTTTTTTTTVTTAATDETTSSVSNNNNDDDDRDILVRCARGEHTSRTPVWLMRQAGRYMSSFREYSDRIPFRERSETPSIAVELSLQCHRAYNMDGIIMFSDILTPLPTLGIEFDVVKGVGPVISTKVSCMEDVMKLTNPNDINFDTSLPFIRDILSTLAKEADVANTSLIGFVGAPFTLAAYTIEGKSSKHCLDTKKMMMSDNSNDNNGGEGEGEGAMSLFLDKLAIMIGNYACYQIECGAQVIQVFESWAHQLSPDQFATFAKPAAQKAIRIIKEKHPTVPVIYFANGGSSYLELQKDMGADMIAVDWSVDISVARQILGPDMPISGNIDPTILFGTKAQIEQAVRDCIDKAGGPGNKHLLNLGHGVMQGTPEEAVGWLVDECKRYRGKVNE